VDVEAKLSGAAPRGGAQVRRPGAYQRAYKELYTLQIVMYCISKDRTASAITGKIYNLRDTWCVVKFIPQKRNRVYAIGDIRDFCVGVPKIQGVWVAVGRPSP